MSEDHTHTAAEVGAADDFHLHHADEVLGLTSQEDLSRLLEKVDALADAVHSLAGQLEAERELCRAVAGGNATAEAIVRALRKTAADLMKPIGPPGFMTPHDIDTRMRISTAISQLAGQVEREVSTP